MKVTKQQVSALLKENDRRHAVMNAPFNPLTGEGSIGERKKVRIRGFAEETMWLPVEMLEDPLVKEMIKRGGVEEWLDHNLPDGWDDNDFDALVDMFVRCRIEYDFCFWAYCFTVIHPKGEGDDVPFKLNRQQRRLIEKYERQRKAGKPIRLVLAKSRQWGGSTATQIYMQWLQLVHKIGLNSIIVGHQKDSAAEVEDMFKKIINQYPIEYLYSQGADFSPTETKWRGDPNTSNIHHIPQRKCKVKIGTAEKPDSARGGDSALVHCTEVAFWKKTEGKKPEAIVRSACAGALPKPYTMIVYESSPNGSGNFFQREYDAAKAGKSMFDSMFVACWDIETYQLPIADPAKFAEDLLANKDSEFIPDERSESGKYYWYLWSLGAPLEAINWYMFERTKYTDHADMASEFPIDDVEAFSYSGARVFDKYKVKAFEPACRVPQRMGELKGIDVEGKGALQNMEFVPDPSGRLWIWEEPEIFTDEKVNNRYLVVVDIGGRGSKADYSVICVFDRYWMMEGDKPAVVAQWYGHIDMDLLSWKAAQIATYYDNALLVIESNTLETKDRDRQVDGDQSEFILNKIKTVYDNLYARKQSEADIREGIPRKFGFHTNVSTKPMIISTLVAIVREGLYIERDARCLDEYLAYEKKQNGAFGAILGKHDDLLMTRAIGLHICFNEMPLPSVVKREEVARLKRAMKRKAFSAASI